MGPDETWVALGEVISLTATGPDRVDALLRAIRRVQGGWWFGGLAFDAHHDPKALPPHSPWTRWPGARFTLPRWVVRICEDEVRLTSFSLGTDGHPKGPMAEVPLTPMGMAPPMHAVGVHEDRAAWNNMIHHTLRSLDEQGTLQKAVMARQVTLTAPQPFHEASVLRRLVQAHPDCTCFALREDHELFFGATPERLVKKHGRRVITEALAGSTRVNAPLHALAHDPKERSEHALVVQAIEGYLRRFTDRVRVMQSEPRTLRHVRHQRTPIEAELSADDVHVLQLVDALHPTPAVCGVPREVAAEHIRLCEGFDRGWYAGPVGWFDHEGDGDFCVALRTGLLRERQAFAFAGAGIVPGSDPDLEWDETELKLRAVMHALNAPSPTP